jgi:drug/metabolite transporter (DMT)-like permease
MKLVAGLAFLLNTILFATYYSVSKEALGRIDPIIFSFFEMTSLVPLALCVMLFSWKDMNRAVVKRGVILGSWLFLALITIAIALKFTTATGTAFFPSLNGFLAAFIAWIFLRQPVKKPTWVAGVLSVAGTILLVLYSSTDTLRGSMIAFLGGVFFTCYVFLTDYLQKDDLAPWPLLSVELLTMALWSNLVVLLFGDWRGVHPSLPHDLWVVLYVALACTFLPTLITVLVQKHLSPVTVSFIYILEPVLGAIIAIIYLHELLPIQGYIGGLLVVVGAIIHTWGTTITRQPSTEQSADAIEERSAAFWQPQVLARSTPAWNVQSHLQVDSVPYSVSRKGEKTLVQRRRHDRLQRISQQGMKHRPEQAQKISAPPAGANLSCASPVYRPSVPSQYPPLSTNDHMILSNTYIEATEMRSR